MARFTVTVPVEAPAGLTWQLVGDWERHGDWIPLTTVRITRVADGVGTRFVGRSGLGSLAFDDPMEVTLFRPPASDEQGAAAGRCEVVKQGRVILGRAWFEVLPQGADRCRLTWGEELEVPPVRLTAPLAPVVSLVGKAAFTPVLWAMARAARRAHRGRA